MEMLQLPIIVPIIIVGFLIGDILRKSETRIGWKRLIFGSLVGGIGNILYAFAFISFKGGDFNQIEASEKTSFLISSFLIGFLIVLIVFVTAIITIKILGRTKVEE